MIFAFEVLLGGLLLFEEWGWRPLADLVGRLKRFPWWARFEAWLAALPPVGALLMFAAPPVALFPIKLLGLWLIADGRFVSAVLLIAAAKLIGTAFVARVFVVTRPTLMTIPWFARLYNWVVPWQEALVARLRATWPWRLAHAIKLRVHEALDVWRARYGPGVRAAVARLAERLGLRSGL